MLRSLLKRLAPRREPAEEQAHVARGDRQRLAGPIALGDLPAARLQEPLDERTDRVRQRLVHGRLREPAVAPVRLRDRQRYDAGLPRELVARPEFPEITSQAFRNPHALPSRAEPRGCVGWDASPPSRADGGLAFARRGCSPRAFGGRRLRPALYRPAPRPDFPDIYGGNGGRRRRRCQSRPRTGGNPSARCAASAWICERSTTGW